MADTPADRSSDRFEQLLERAARLSPLGPGDFPRLHPGRELCSGRLLVRRRLGAGGMGVVYEALDRERRSSVALKTLARLDATSIYRLKNEFRALAEVKHPNLVRLHELFVDGDIWLFTMELVVGEPFDAWVRPAGTLDPARLRSALAQLVVGVQAIHEGGKLHRDLKPSNVLVTPEGRLVIMDFGLVSDPEPGGEGQTLADERSLGTPAYMAPEQAGGAGATTASDWYSVGVMLFEALTGELPIDGATYEILWRKQKDPAPRASTRKGDVPADLDQLCAELLERDPQQRPPGSRIEQVLREQGPSQPSASMPPGPRRTHELLGRPSELAALRAALADAESGRLIVVRVLGAIGLGKSALVRAFLDELTGREHTVVLSGRCYEREAIPYKAFDRVIDELSRFLRQQPESEVGALLPRDAAALHRLFPVLGRVQAIADAPLRKAADDHALRRRAFDALAELLARIRDRAMLVIHIDDAHWTDADSVRLLEHLVSLPDAAPLLLVLGQRTPAASDALLPRFRGAALENPRMELRDLELGPLSLHDATELAHRRLGTQHTREMAAALAAEASGNPFLVCELSRHAAEGRTAAVTLEEALGVRFAALGDDERRLLELVAVSGRPTPVEVLTAAGDARTDTYLGLEALCEAQLARRNGARSYECYHDSIRTALCNGLSGEVIRAHHERLAFAYEQCGHADPEVLFGHAHAAGQHTRAGASAVEAANATASSLAFDRSATFLAHAIELLPDAQVRSLRLRERRGEALSLCGRWADAALAFDEAAEHAPDEAERMRLLRQSAAHFLGCGRSREGLPRLRRVLQASGITWPRTRLGAWLSAASRLFWLWWKGAQPRRAMTTTMNSTAPAGLIAPGSTWTPSSSPAWEARSELLLHAAALVPPYDSARGLHFASVFVQWALGRPDMPNPIAGTALGMLAALFAGVGVARASSRRWASEAMALARTQNLPPMTSTALTFAAHARLSDGRLREALELANEAERALSGADRAAFYQSWTTRAVQGLALFSLGRIGEAAQCFADNARRAREVGDDLAVVAGSSVIQFLPSDDVAAASALLERKEAMLAEAGTRGVMRETVALDRILLALYQNCGADLLRARGRGSAASAFFDDAALLACCALQGPHDATCRRTLRAALRAQPPSAVGLGVGAQLRATLRLMEGNALGAQAELALASEHYAAAEMALHAALMRWRAAALRADAAGEHKIEKLRSELVALGAARPERWLDALAPGLGPR